MQHQGGQCVGDRASPLRVGANAQHLQSHLNALVCVCVCVLNITSSQASASRVPSLLAAPSSLRLRFRFPTESGRCFCGPDRGGCHNCFGGCLTHDRLFHSNVLGAMLRWVDFWHSTSVAAVGCVAIFAEACHEVRAVHADSKVSRGTADVELLLARITSLCPRLAQVTQQL